MPLKPVEQHYMDVLGLGAPLPAAEVVLPHAEGLVLAEDVTAAVSIPPFTSAQVSGYAVRAVDVKPGKEMPVAGSVMATSTQVQRLRPGTALRVAAGAPIPVGADSVLPAKLVASAADSARSRIPRSIVPLEKPPLGRSIRMEGEDVPAGSIAFPAGTELTAAHLASLAFLGHTTARIHRRPIVSIVASCADQRDYDDSHHAITSNPNTVLVAALVDKRGGAPRVSFIPSDNPAVATERLCEIAATVDLIITTDRASASAFDASKDTAAFDGARFEKVAMQPGRPQGWGKIIDTPRSTSEAFGFTTMPVHAVPLLCLPSSSLSAFVSMHLFALPLIDAMLGRKPRDLADLFTPELAGADWEHAPGRDQFMPIMLNAEGHVVPAYREGMRCHMLGPLPYASGLARVASDAGDVRCGDRLGVMWFPTVR